MPKMYSKLFLSIVTSFATIFVAKCIDQCDNFPVDVTFYVGTSPSEFGGGPPKEIGELIGSLGEGLAKLFQEFNSTTTLFPPMEDSGTTPAVAHPHVALDLKPLPNGPDPMGPLGDLSKKLPFAEILHKIVPPAPSGEKSNISLQLGGFKFGEAASAESSAEGAWGISVPLSVTKVELARIKNGKISGTLKIDSIYLSNVNKTKKDMTKFAQNIDLSELAVKARELFIVCLTMNVVKNDKQSSCQRCLLMTACDSVFDSGCIDRFITLQGPQSKVHPTSANLQYLILDPPLADMKMVTSAFVKSFDVRCDENKSNKTIEKTSKIFGNTLTYVELANLSPKETYSIQTDLVINWSDHVKAPFGWSSPLIIPDYLDSKQEYVIYACGKSLATVHVKK